MGSKLLLKGLGVKKMKYFQGSFGSLFFVQLRKKSLCVRGLFSSSCGVVGTHFCCVAEKYKFLRKSV